VCIDALLQHHGKLSQPVFFRGALVWPAKPRIGANDVPWRVLGIRCFEHAVACAGVFELDLTFRRGGLENRDGPSILRARDGIEAARQIRTLVPNAKIIFLTQESSPEVIQEAKSLGASGYVLKIEAETDLVAAVEAVLHGRQFFEDGTGSRGR